MVEEYLQQSLPYLQHTQVTLREAAVRFIGEPQPPGSLFWQPQLLQCPESPPRPGLGPQGPRATPCPRKWAWGAPCRVLTGALCLGLAAQHCKDQSERKIHEICSGERGQRGVGSRLVGQGAFTFLRGKGESLYGQKLSWG